MLYTVLISCPKCLAFRPARLPGAFLGTSAVAISEFVGEALAHLEASLFCLDDADPELAAECTGKVHDVFLSSSSASSTRNTTADNSACTTARMRTSSLPKASAIRECVSSAVPINRSSVAVASTSSSYDSTNNTAGGSPLSSPRQHIIQSPRAILIQSQPVSAEPFHTGSASAVNTGSAGGRHLRAAAAAIRADQEEHRRNGRAGSTPRVVQLRRFGTHPNILGLHGFTVSLPHLMLVLEYAELGDLKVS